MHRSLLLSMLLLLGSPALAANAPSFQIGDVTVSVGTPEADVIPKLKKSYDTAEIRGGLFQFTDKGNKANVVGIVEIREGKVSFASRDLGAFEGEAVRNFGRALFKALEVQKGGGEQTVKVTTQLDSRPDYAVSMLTFTLQGRQVVLYLGADGGAVEASMEEILTAPSPESTPATP